MCARARTSTSCYVVDDTQRRRKTVLTEFQIPSHQLKDLQEVKLHRVRVQVVQVRLQHARQADLDQLLLVDIRGLRQLRKREHARTCYLPPIWIQIHSRHQEQNDVFVKRDLLYTFKAVVVLCTSKPTAIISALVR